jgi:hypothetical protein
VPIEAIGWVDFTEGNRWGAGLPGLRIWSLELISGDFKRFKGISLDSKSKYFQQARVNHLSLRLAIISESKPGRQVTHFLNRLDHAQNGY